MPKYEYKVLPAPKNGRNVDYTKFQAQLNVLGQQGWKVVGTGGAGAGGSNGGTTRRGWAILMREE